MKKTFLVVFFFPFLLLSQVALSQPAFKVGALVPYSGRWGDSGRECARGLLDGTKWINQHEGVSGRKLEILLVDDTSQPAEFMAAYRKLNEADRIPILFIYSAETAFALAPHFHYDQIPALVSPFPSQFADVSKYPYVFSILPTQLDLAKIAMNFVSDKSGIKVRKPKVIFVGPSDPLGGHFLDETKEYARALGIDIGPDVWISDLSRPGDKAEKYLLSLVAAINSYNPDFACLNLTSKEASSLLQEVKKMDMKRIRWICTPKAFDENLSAFEGVLGVQPIAPFGEGIPGMAAIKEGHQKWHPFDSHTLSYVEGWATARVISEVLRKSFTKQGLSRASVKSALEGLRSFGTGGLIPPITVTPKDHRPSTESRIFIVKDGKLSRHTSFISLPR